MWAMHDSVRRRVAVALFLLLCPTTSCAALAWGVWVARPGHRLDVEKALAERLGLHVQIAAVRYPVPGQTLLEGVQLLDDETRRPLFKARLLQIHHEAGRRLIHASQPELFAEGTAELRDWLDRMLRAKRLDEHAPVEWAASEVTLHAGEASQTFTHVHGAFLPESDGNRVSVEFRLAGAPHNIPALLEMSRLRTASPPATQIVLRTGPTPLPCPVLSRRGELADWLGARSTFEGELRLTDDGRAWRGEISGRVKGINLYKLVHQRFPHTLSGVGELTLTRACWEDGRLTEAAGRLEAGPGSVSGSLLSGLADGLEMRLAADPPHDQLLHYDELALAFDMSGGHLSVRGACPSSPTSILTLESRTLVEEPARLQTIAGLIRSLSPPGDLLVPATLETDFLLSGLPLPSFSPSSPPHPLTSAPSPPRLRLGRISPTSPPSTILR